MTAVSEAVFIALAKWWESGALHRNGSQLRYFYPGLTSALMSSGALTPDQLDDWVTDMGGDSFPVEETKPGFFVRYDRECFEVEVPEADLRRYRLVTEWLPQNLTEMLGSHRKPECWLQDKLWFLGNYRVGRKYWPVWLARRLRDTEVFDAVDYSLQHPRIKDGVILTLQPPRRQQCARLSGAFEVVALRDVVAGNPVSLDLSWLQDPVETAIQWDDAAGVLHVMGMPAWTVDGPKQRMVVHLLFEAWQSGRNTVSTEELQEAGITSRTPGQLWRKGSRWESYIGYGDKRWWLLAP
jgi:hypothetical protein